MRNFFSTQHLFKTRTMVMIALMVALRTVLNSFTIYLTPTVKAITFANLPGAVVATLYGPVAGLVFGFISDPFSYMVKPAGPYFIGYAFSEMAINFIFALLLYKREIKVWRVLVAQVMIVLFVYCGMNFLWVKIMYGSVAGTFFTGARFLNYAIQTPLHVAMTVFFCRFALHMETSRLAVKH